MKRFFVLQVFLWVATMALAASGTADLESFRQSALAGQADGQFNLGLCYFKGTRVQKDYAVAAEWFRKAAEQGHMEAQWNYAGLFYDGRGVRQDYKQCIEWTRKAAEQGHADAQYTLGQFYIDGAPGIGPDGTYTAGASLQPDLIQAYRWLSLVEASGAYPHATSRVVDKLTPAQLEEAKSLAADWPCVQKKP